MVAENCTNIQLHRFLLNELTLWYVQLYPWVFPVYLHRLAIWPVKQDVHFKKLQLFYTPGGILLSLFFWVGIWHNEDKLCVTHLNDWSNNVDMNPVLSKMSDENNWWLNNFFVLKNGKQTHESVNKALWSKKDEMFNKDEEIKEI